MTPAADNPTPPTQEAPPNPDAAPPQKPAAAIGHVAIKGMAWMVAQSIGIKSITVIQQLLLAKFFLSKEDFGLIAVSQGVISIVSLGQNLGVGEMLVRRHRRFAKWVDAGFWLNLTGGLVGMLLIMALLPIWEPLFLSLAALFGHHVTAAPQIKGLLAIWSLWLPLDAILQVFNARLRVNMRFRVLVLLGSMHMTGLAITGLVLAVLGCGVYSLVIPLPLMMTVTVGAGWILSRQRIRRRLNMRRWPVMLRDSRYFLLGNVFNTLLLQGDYMIASVFFNETLLGAYYFAYRMSTQTLQLIGGNMTSVFLPSFSRLDTDEQRRSLAFERTCATLQLIGVPLCFLQALLAAPVFHLLFKSKYDDALPLFEVLSIGMAFALPTTAATSLLLAQGRYRWNVTWMGIMAAGFLLFVFSGALLGSVFYVACFVCAFFMLIGPLSVVLPLWHAGPGGVWVGGGAIGRLGGVTGFLWRVYGFPVLASVLAAGAGWGVSFLLPDHGIILSIANIALRTFICMMVFLLAVIIVKPPVAMELFGRLRGMLRRH